MPGSKSGHDGGGRVSGPFVNAGMARPRDFGESTAAGLGLHWEGRKNPAKSGYYELKYLYKVFSA